jgi:transcriptional pleiotropic regulator of transition state genes
MKSTGIVRRIDDLGRVVLPKELRRTYGIEEGDPMEIFTDEDSIILRKYQPREQRCRICGKDTHLFKIDGIHICRECGEKIRDKIMEA